MKGRATFSQSEVETIRWLLTEKMKADRGHQKRFRDKLRKLGFYITDFSASFDGFTEHDFMLLIERGRIRVIDSPTLGPGAPKVTKQPNSTPELQTSADYAAAAAKYRPEKIRLLILAEAPPAEASRYFYFEGVNQHDSLWVESMKMLYADEFAETSVERRRKPYWLCRFRDDGCFLIDAVKTPVTGDKDDIKQEIAANLDTVISEIRELQPDGVLIVKKVVWEALGAGMRSTGLPVLNDGPVMFPGSGQQGKFHAEVKRLRIQEFVRDPQ